MRVVGGKAKGRRLAGSTSPATRPTTERVRAAIFNILAPELYEGRRVLDLYAGTGSLGIEALSRGAAWADFVERSPRQCGVIRSNLQNTGLAGQAKVHCADVARALATLGGNYRLVLLDPPYQEVDAGVAMSRIAETPGLVAPGGMVVVGHSRHLELTEKYDALRRASLRRYGDNIVEFYQQEGG
ncbi:MAG: 16S rRNA (guanine(966)-N(2))-methyltransferase RsmD [SAR202 cluster bacterium]|nr:16S rRNA (guanine(966)-N(2))-methyltransferase RsmD [SAR202 cluster bacterium]